MALLFLIVAGVIATIIVKVILLSFIFFAINNILFSKYLILLLPSDNKLE